jgi:hypothetical protein
MAVPFLGPANGKIVNARKVGLRCEQHPDNAFSTLATAAWVAAIAKRPKNHEESHWPFRARDAV